jgi:hypothetical protein
LDLWDDDIDADENMHVILAQVGYRYSSSSFLSFEYSVMIGDGSLVYYHHSIEVARAMDKE